MAFFQHLKCFFGSHCLEVETKRFFNFAYYDTKRRKKCKFCSYTESWIYGPR